MLERGYQVPSKLIRILRALFTTRDQGSSKSLWKGVRGIQHQHWCKARRCLSTSTFFGRHHCCNPVSTCWVWCQDALQSGGDSLVGSRKKMREEVSIQDLEYADDMTLVSDSMDVLEELLRILHTTCLGMGLSISCKKFKILAVCPTNSTR